MRNRATRIAVPWSSNTAKLTGDYIHLPFHAQGSAADKVTNYGTIGPAEFTLGGTTTDCWATAGALTVGVDNFINLSQSPGDLGGLVGPDAPHGLLCLCEVNVPNITSKLVMFDNGASVAASGGIEFRLNNSEIPQFQFRAPTEAAAETYSAPGGAISQDTWTKLMFFFGSDLIARIALPPAAHAADDPAFVGPVAAMGSTMYARLFGQASLTATPSAGLNSHPCLIRDYWLIRPSADITALLDQISYEYALYSKERLLPSFVDGGYV
jgi:hypothetical protein